MRILFVLGTFPSVSKTFILNQIKGLIDEGHEVQVLALREGEQEIEHDLVQQYNLESRTTYVNPPDSYSEALKYLVKGSLKLFRSKGIITEPVNQLLNGGKYAPMKISTLERFMNLGEFGVIHYHFGTRAKNSIHLQKFTDAKSVTSFYGYDISQVNNSEAEYRTVFSYSDVVLSLTDKMTEELENKGCPKNKIQKVPLGIDLEKFELRPREKSSEEPYKILTVGRFVEKKGIKYGLEAVAEFDEEYDIEYNIVGDGELREKIEQKIEELGLQQEVTLHGYVEYSKMREMMYENHILLAPSVTAESGDKEGAPMVIIEGQATEMPVISTRHSGIPEIVKQGDSAYLAEERNSQELAEKLEKMLEESDQWHKKGLDGREFIEQKHSIEKMAKNLEELYMNTSRRFQN